MNKQSKKIGKHKIPQSLPGLLFFIESIITSAKEGMYLYFKRFVCLFVFLSASNITEKLSTDLDEKCSGKVRMTQGSIDYILAVIWITSTNRYQM